MKSQFLIGAASSGSGKTTLTIGLLRALHNRGKRIQPYKCGPDYIDTLHHEKASGKPSVNLDLFMMSKPHIQTIYRRYAMPAEVLVTEGVMGLFDGFDRMQGSSAEVAQLLGLPVILVVNAKSTAYSVAPLIYGFKHFNPSFHLAGVIFNFVASENHYRFLRQAAEDAGVEALGYIPKQAEIEIPGRHLGLTTDAAFHFDQFADAIAGLAEAHIDIDRLLEITQKPLPDAPSNPDTLSIAGAHRPQIGRIAVARDEAFSFMYEENLHYLRQCGEVICFSPIHDKQLPDADFIYLPGGYPEFSLQALSANRNIRQQLRQYIEDGGKLLAECGGMMYLCDAICDESGTSFPMTGILPQQATLQKMKLTLGYRQLLYKENMLKGHEFHYSHIVPQKDPVPSVAEAFTAKGLRTQTPLYAYKNILAGYTHLYWADESRNKWFTDFLNS